MDPTNPNLYGRQYNFPANSTNTGASLQNFMSNPALQSALYAGGPIGGGSTPVVQNILAGRSGNAQSWGQILPEAGPLGAGVGGALGNFVGNRFDGEAGIGYQAPDSYQYPGQAAVTSNQGGMGYQQQPGQATVTSYQGDSGYLFPEQAVVTSYGYGPTQAGIGYQAPQSGRAVVTSYGAGQPGIGYQAPQTSYGSSQAGMGYNGTMSPKKKTCGCGH
jgi:hypothetical protein